MIRRQAILSVFLLCSTCIAFSLPSMAAEEFVVLEPPAQVQNASGMLPDLYEPQTDTYDLIKAHIFTGAELDHLLGSFPRYLISGSSVLNELNGFSVPNTSALPIVEVSSQYVIVRPSWESLETEISDKLAAYQGDWSVYIKDMETGKTMEINEHAMESASLIKLYIAGAVYEQMDEGNLSASDSVLSSLDAMITVSDNESANVLVRKLMGDSGDFQTGLDKVNDFISRNGFSNTQQVNGIADPSLWIGDGINETSTADCGRLLEMIYNGTLVSGDDSAKFESLLGRQQVNYKIPEGLPDGVRISHKTGEVSDTENDAAIIYTPYGDYIFCIMSTALTDKDAAVEHIRSITSLVYNYFTGHVVAEEHSDGELAEYLPQEPYILYKIEEHEE